MTLNRLAFLEHENKLLNNHKGELIDKVWSLESENKKLREALEFYADDENYILQPLKDKVEGQLMWVTPIAHENYGDRARKALEGTE